MNSASFRVEADPRADRDLKKLRRTHPDVVTRLIGLIDRLPTDPFQRKPLKGEKEGCYSLRYGDYRIIYCAVHKTGDSPPGTAQSGGESEEGRRPAPLGRARGEGRELAARLVQVRGPSPRTKQRERMCSQNSALLSMRSTQRRRSST
jgi:addiction module RelE/StbE family toxin